jgi:hypothetical protein
VLHDLNPELLVKLFQHIDVKTAAENWPKRLQEDPQEIRRHARKVFRLARDHGPGGISALAARLLRKRKNPTNEPKRYHLVRLRHCS